MRSPKPIIVPELFPDASEWLQASRASLLEQAAKLGERWAALGPEPTRDELLPILHAEVNARSQLQGHITRQHQEVAAMRDNWSRKVVRLRAAIVERGDNPEVDPEFHHAKERLTLFVRISQSRDANRGETLRMRAWLRELRDHGTSRETD